MTNLKKINTNYEKRLLQPESDVYRKFSQQFDKLFNAEELAKNKEEFESIYVNDKDFERDLKNFFGSETNMEKFCIGYTGMGKTTSIRYCLNLGVSNEPFLDKKEKRIVFPTFLDGYQVKDMDTFDLSNRIAAVCTKLENENPELREHLKTLDGKKELYDFIYNHTSFVLENINPIKAMNMTEEELICAKLEGAYQKNSYEFQANKLKYYIKKSYDKYERLIIVLDDIESLPETYQNETIRKYLKLYSCMQNTDYPNDGKYCINLLISVRPHTYRIFRNNRKIETFPISEPPITKRNAVNLEDLFQKRFDYYSKATHVDIGNKDTWKECYDELMHMNKAFDGKYKEMIINLCFMNVREALACYSRIFANRFWVQKNKNKEEAFKIYSPEYSFNNINVIRALACGEESVFWEEDEEENKIIPNLFFNTEENDYSIYCLLVMNYFKKRKNEEDYGINANELKNIKKEWNDIFGKEISKRLTNSLKYLFEKKILRKSLKDVDDIKTLDKGISIKNDSRLYISSRGSELFEMFGRDSVLLELLRECEWRNYDNRDYSELSSNDLMLQGRQDEIFIDLLEYIDYLCDMEDEVLKVVYRLKKIDKYKQIFGSSSVVNILLKGVKNSLDYSGYLNYGDIKSRYYNLSQKIKNFI